jgi:acyl-CoA reductase-like NAD-dependent aldehyde dehydrogenase
MAKTHTVTSPFDNSRLYEFEYATNDQIESALATLHAGRENLIDMPSFQKAQILEKLSHLVDNNLEEIATIVAQEIGKPIKETRGEIKRAASVALCASHEARRIEGEILDCNAYSDMGGKTCHVMYAPLGTVLAITPFNFPFNLAMHKVAPAFASSNTVFLKPGPQNFKSTQLLVDLCYEAGFPKDSLIMLCPEIPAMEAIIKDKRINCINFTGGLVAANIIAKQAGFKKLILELGGNDPLIVLPDGDIEKAVNTAIAQRFGTAGQRCNAAKRVFIHEDCYEPFKNLLLEKTKNLTIGNPLDEATDIGPVINSHAADEIMQRIEAAIASGAKLLIGNKRENNIVYPTIFEEVTHDMELVKEETFGPVIPLFKFNEIEQVIKLVNSSEYALQSGVFTQNIEIIKKLHCKLEVGSVNVNEGPGFRADHMPFGGVKQSGIGREGLRYAIKEMSYQKNLIF